MRVWGARLYRVTRGSVWRERERESVRDRERERERASERERVRAREGCGVIPRDAGLGVEDVALQERRVGSFHLLVFGV